MFGFSLVVLKENYNYIPNTKKKWNIFCEIIIINSTYLICVNNVSVQYG